MNDMKPFGLLGYCAPDGRYGRRISKGHLDVSGFPQVLKLIENRAAIFVWVELDVRWGQGRIRGDN